MRRPPPQVRVKVNRTAGDRYMRVYINLIWSQKEDGPCRALLSGVRVTKEKDEEGNTFDGEGHAAGGVLRRAAGACSPCWDAHSA